MDNNRFWMVTHVSSFPILYVSNDVLGSNRNNKLSFLDMISSQLQPGLISLPSLLNDSSLVFVMHLLE